MPGDYAPPLTKAQRVAQDFIWSYDNVNTRKNYEAGLKAWFRFCEGLRMDPIDGYGDGEGVRRSDVEKFLRWSEEVKGEARHTVAHRFSSIRGFYRRAIIDGVIEKDPSMYVKAPRVERKTTSNDLTRAQFVRVLQCAQKRSARDYAIFCLLGYNGLRVAELCGLKVTDIGSDLGFTTITILRKGGFTQTLSVSMQTAHAVAVYIGERQVGPLFLSLRAPYGPMKPGDVQRLVKRYAKLCDIAQRITPHSFRHTFVTQALNAGVSQREVQKAAGHADARMTAYYDHGSGNRGKEATHMLSAYIAEMM